MHVARCFDIGGTKTVVADVNMNGECIEQARMPTPTKSFSDFLALIKAHCPNNTTPIGLSVAGVLQPDTGMITSANIPCLSGKQLSAELSKSLQREVYVVNDANAFALAEATFGIASQHYLVLAIILGTGVGGGIVANGKILNGIGGTTGEWGHGPASTARTGSVLPALQCQCGQMQCVEGLGGARGLERLYTHSSSKQLECKQIINAWEIGDKAASEAVDVWLDVVGGALANIVNFLDPSIVVVGGGLANAKNLIDSLDHEVRSRCLTMHKTPLLQAAINGPEQGLLGALINCQLQSN